MKTVAFTGYRPEKLPFSENNSDVLYIKFRKRLMQVINRLVERGYTNFISGVATGFDTWAAEDVISLKKDNCNIKLECAIPFSGQAERWGQVDIKRRNQILKHSNRNTMVCKHYRKDCFFIRNEYMVDKADVVVCCYDGQSGGTAQTVNYARKRDKIIIQINPHDASVSIISRKGFE